MDQNNNNLGRLTPYREAIKQAAAEFREAEVQLEKEQEELNAFEKVIDAHLKPLMNQLNLLQEEIDATTIEIDRRQSYDVYGDNYPTIEEQLRGNNEKASVSHLSPQPISLENTGKKGIKKIYRQLARCYHPDLTTDDYEKARRTEQMTAINGAYAANSMIEMVTLSEVLSQQSTEISEFESKQEILRRALESELLRIKQQVQKVKLERKYIHNHPMVQLSLQFKLAQRAGRNLMREMAAELEIEIETKSNELDRLREANGIPLKQLTNGTVNRGKSALAKRLLGNTADARAIPRLSTSH